MFGWDQVSIIIAVIGLLAVWITWVINRVDRDVNSLSTKIENISARMDARFESQEARTDRLYEMFVQLLKEKK